MRMRVGMVCSFLHEIRRRDRDSGADHSPSARGAPATPPMGLGEEHAVILGLMEETRDMLLGDKRQELGQRGAQPGNQNARKEKRPGQNKRVNNTFVRGSTNVAYLTARLARDRPDILQRLQAKGGRKPCQSRHEPGLCKNL